MAPTKTIELSATLAFVLMSACAGPQTPSATAPAPPPLHQGPLTDFVASAGLRWLLVGSPKHVAENPAFREAVSVLFPGDRVDGFAAGSGVDLRNVESALIAGFDFGTLYAVEPSAGSAPRIVARFRERIVSGEQRHPSHPLVERITGVIGTTPETLVRVEQRLIAVAVGDPTPARVVEAFARKKLPRSPTALRGAALSTLAPPPAGSVATFYAPGPFSGEWARGARGLLADTLALSISVVPLDAGRARFVVQIAGDFPPSGIADLTRAVSDLAQSPMGKLLGLDQFATPPLLRERANSLWLEAELKLGPIARGLRAAVSADVWEIMDMNAPQ